MNIQVFKDLVREHERAVSNHDQAVKDHNEFKNETTLASMLRLGSAASYTGGKLEGFALGLMAILDTPVED